jgi:hypothetical protein
LIDSPSKRSPGLAGLAMDDLNSFVRPHTIFGVAKGKKLSLLEPMAQPDRSLFGSWNQDLPYPKAGVAGWLRLFRSGWPAVPPCRPIGLALPWRTAYGIHACTGLSAATIFLSCGEMRFFFRSRETLSHCRTSIRPSLSPNINYLSSS